MFHRLLHGACHLYGLFPRQPEAGNVTQGITQRRLAAAPSDTDRPLKRDLYLYKG